MGFPGVDTCAILRVIASTHIAGDASNILEAKVVHGNGQSVDDIARTLRRVSLRPRFAGDGRLRLPLDVKILYRSNDFGNQGDIIGDLADAGYDPFQRVTSDLLLAEEFARVDLTNRRAARLWYLEHGVLDLAHFFPADDFEVSDHVREDPGFHDAQVDVLQQQANVRWHLTALTHLSDERERAVPPRTGWQPHDGWDPAWAQPALRDPTGGALWLGGSSNFESRITPLMQRYARFEDVVKGGSPSEYNLAGVTPKQFTEVWWPTAHSAWKRITRERIPVLWVPLASWYEEDWIEYDIEQGPPSGRSTVGRLSADWWGLAELERRLLGPYVRRAAEYQVEIGRAGLERDLTREGESLGDRFPGPLVAHERRWWSSLLAPIYIQLLEGLRRVTEGQRGAAFCRECGQPFLTLDARRSSFCTDRERFRFSQRERRKRLGAQTAAAETDDAS
jgi:hypothetical protein